MLYPSIDELLLKINSKYSLVTIASKRARYLHNNHKEITIDNPISHKIVGTALEEIYQGKIEYGINLDKENNELS